VSRLGSLFLYISFLIIDLMNSKSNKRLKANSKIRIFFIFLILTMVVWMLIKLSKSYTSEIIFDVEYINLPKNKEFQSDAIREVKATVFSSGFNLLSYKFKRKKLQFDISNLAYKEGTKYYYLPNKHLSEFKLILNDESILERISRDTIFITLGANTTKKVPVELNVDVQFKLGYNFVDAIKIKPDFVEITGPESVLDTINIIFTERVELVEVSMAINEKVQLVIPNNERLSFSTQNITLIAEVDKFTEGRLTVPFEIVNLPANYKITTFPKEIAIIYKVGLKNFNKITINNLQVLCDFDKSLDNKLNYLVPYLKEQSPLISSVRFVPNKIEFLIEK